MFFFFFSWKPFGERTGIGIPTGMSRAWTPVDRQAWSRQQYFQLSATANDESNPTPQPGSLLSQQCIYMRGVLLLLLQLAPAAGLLGSWAAAPRPRLSRRVSQRVSKMFSEPTNQLLLYR